MANVPKDIENRFLTSKPQDYERLIRDLKQTVDDLNVQLKAIRAILDVLSP